MTTGTLSSVPKIAGSKLSGLVAGSSETTASRVAPHPAEGASEAQRERDLVARHRAGDRSAFEDFYHQFATLVYNLALRQSGDVILAQDLTQEAFLRLYKNLGKFEGRSSLKTWTYRVVLNHCRTRLSRRRPPQQMAVDEQGNELELEDEGRGPQARTEISESRRQVEMALGEVEPSYREAVVLRDIEGLSYQEIADVLEVPVGTVRSRIARGRGQLRTAVLAADARRQPRPPTSMSNLTSAAQQGGEQT